jgi:hypothetical protein
MCNTLVELGIAEDLLDGLESAAERVLTGLLFSRMDDEDVEADTPK